VRDHVGMEITLLGTGGLGGLPAPGCPCAACSAAACGMARNPSSLLVDGMLLLDLTPGPALAAARAGWTLSGVRHVLLSRPRSGPLVDLPPGLPAPGRVPDGEQLALLTGHRVRAVAVDAPGTGYEITDPSGNRLLYLPAGCSPAGLDSDQAGRTQQGARGGRPVPYDMVLLDVVGRPDALAGLRAVGLVGGTTDVVAVHIGHEAPPEPELHRQLGAVGARAVPDGQSLIVGEYAAVPDVPRRTLVLGGARSGKSAEAERRLAAFPGVLYVATAGGRADDLEWEQRVRAHRERRPSSWRTEETCDLVPLLAKDGPPMLVDCLALWLTDAMDRVGAWDEERWASGGARELAVRTAKLTDAWRATRRTVVAVSNEVGSGVVPATASGRRFRDELGKLNAAIAAESEHVLLVTAGIALPLRGL